MSVTLNPYLNFDGQTLEAMSFYKSVFGGELLVTIMGESFPGHEKPDHIMHASLASGDMYIMASDHMDPKYLEVGNNVHLSLNGLDEEKMRAYFDGLSEGGNVEQPLEKAPWGDTFGSFTDKYGIHWMVNIHHEL